MFSTPLDEPFRVDLRGEIRDPIAGGAHPFNYRGLSFEVGAGNEVSVHQGGFIQVWPRLN